MSAYIYIYIYQLIMYNHTTLPAYMSGVGMLALRLHMTE